MRKNNQKRSDDFSPEHLSWLVERRSENQKSALNLHLIMRKYSTIINDNEDFEYIAEALVAVTFSLWRAVFLSDLTDGSSKVLSDAHDFLGNLVLHNAVAYLQDRSTREWTFVYYMNNSGTRLHWLTTGCPVKILHDTDFPDLEGQSDKEWWARDQSALNRAIENFERVLERAESKN